MATLFVLNGADSGPGSLRAILDQADLTPEADTIRFDAALTGTTITLTSGPLNIESRVTILGDQDNDGDADITISGGGAVSIFTVASGVTATLNAVAMTQGNGTAGSGAIAFGGISNSGTLGIVNCKIGYCAVIGDDGPDGFPGDAAYNGGGGAGAILNRGNLSLVNTQFYNNAVYAGDGGEGGDGDGISYGGSYTGKRGGAGGDAAAGILNMAGATLSLAGVTFTGHAASAGSGGNGGDAINTAGPQSVMGGAAGDGGDAALGILNFGTITGGAVLVGAGTANFGEGGLGGEGGINQSGPGFNGFAGKDGVAANLALGIGTGGDDTYTGFGGADTYYAGDGDDTVLDSAGSDIVYGGEDDDTLTGSAGDTIYGGDGNDTIINTNVIGGIYDGGGGSDTLDFSQDSGTTGTYVMGTTFTTSFGGTFKDFENMIGSPLGEIIIGHEGGNRLEGRGGDDTLDGADVSTDALIGGTGDDTYVNPAGDIITEAAGAAGGTHDLIRSNASFNVAAAPNVEDITLTGTANINAIGGIGNNRLTGNSGNNTLNGGGGNDTLAGLGGADTMNGGAGNDVYVNPDAADTIGEAAGAAGGLHDKIQSLSSFNISTVANVEDITLVGATNVNAIGNNLANILIGNAGNNTILGGGGTDTITGAAGNDTMNGGAGADLFKFATANTGADTIAGFETSADHFDLGGGTFASRTEAGGNTTLTHAGGTIVVSGVTGLSVAQWNDLVVGGAREAHADDGDAVHRVHPAASAGHAGHADFLFA